MKTVIEMAREAGFSSAVGKHIALDNELEAFAALVRADALAEQPAQQEPVAYLCENAVGHKYFRWKKPSGTYKPIALYTAPQPAQRTWVVPDAIHHTDTSESPEYIQGWNDCREAMRSMK